MSKSTAMPSENNEEPKKKKEVESPLDKLINKVSKPVNIIIQAQRELPVLSTGVFPFDLALGTQDPVFGNGGLRAKDMMEVAAKNGSGKTALAFASMAATMKRFPGDDKIIAAYFSEPPDEDQFLRMAIQGVDPDRVIWIGLECSGNKALEQLLELVSYKEIKHAYIDSVAAIPVSANDDKGLEDSEAVAALAKVYNRFSARYIKETAFAPLIYCNHYRDPVSTGRPGQSGPPPSPLDPQTIGGKTKDFLSKARAFFSTTPKWEKDNKHSFSWSDSNKAIKIDEIKIKVKVPRNKYAPPMREFEILYDLSTFKFNNAETTIKLASAFADKVDGQWKSLIEPAVFHGGSYYTIAGEKFQGIDNAIAYLDSKPELMLEIQRQIIPMGKRFWDDALNLEDELDK